MATRSLGRLIVQLAVEMAKYQGDWKQAEQITKDGAAKIDQASRGGAAGVDKLTDALRGQTGAAGDAAGKVVDAARAAQGLAGASTAVTAGAGAAAVALGALAVAAYQGAKEQRALQDSLILTGNYAGLVSGQIDRMAMKMAGSLGGSVSASREVLASLTATGRFTVQSLGEVSQAVQLVARFSGQTNQEVLKDFASMADGVAKWAAKHNEAYHFLDIETYRYIKRLEDQGQVQEAARVTSEALSMHLGGDLTRNLGIVERAWLAVKREASDAWTAMKSVGKDETTDEILGKSSNYLARARQGWMGANDPRLGMLQQQNFELLRRSEREQRSASDRTALAQATSAAIKADEEWEKITGRLATREEKMNAELEKARKLRADRGAQVTDAAQLAKLDADLAKVEQRIREQYADKGRKATTVDPYEQLIRSAKERVAVLGEEANGTEKLTDAEKARAKYLEALKSGYIKFNDVRDRALRLTLDEQEAAEKAARARAREAKETEEAQKAYADQVAKTEQRTEKLKSETTADLEHARAIGLSKTEIGNLTAAKLEDMAASLERKAVMFEEQAIATELTQAWRAEAAALRERAAAARTRAGRETEFEAEQKQAKDLEDVVRRTDDAARQMFRDMARDGTSAFKAIGKAAEAELFDLLYQWTLRPFVISAVLAVRGGGMDQVSSLAQVGGGANLVSGMGTASSLYSSLGLGGFSTAAGATMQNGLISGFGANMANIGTLLEGGSYMSALGAAMPYLAIAAVAAQLISGATKGETRSGGHYGYNATTGATSFLHGPSGGDPAGKEMAGLINASVATINSVFAGLGMGTRVNEFHGAYESSEKDRGGVYTGGTLSSGRTFGESGRGSNYDGTLYELTSARTLDTAEAIKNATTDSFQVVIQAWQAEIDKLPRAMAQIIEGVDAESLSQEQAQDIIDRVTAVVSSVAQFSDAIRGLPFADWAAASVDQRAQLLTQTNGQAAALMGQYFGNYYSAEEQRAQTVRNIQRLLGSAGANFTEAEINAGDQGKFRQLTDYYAGRQDAEGIRIFGALLQVNAAFKTLAPEVQAVAEAAAEATDTLGDAYRAFERAMSIERDRADAARQAAQEVADAERARFEVLKAGRIELQSQVDSTRAWLAAQGNDFLAQQLAAAQAGSYLADAEQLNEAIRAAMGGLNADDFAGNFEFDRARLVLAGRLQQLEGISGGRLSVADQQLQAAEQQVKYLDDLLEQERLQTETLQEGFLTLAEGLARLNQAQGGQPAAAGGGLAAKAGGASFGGGATASAGVYQLVTSMGLPVDLAGYAMAHLDDPQAIAAYTRSMGGTMADLAAAVGKPLADVETWFGLQGVPSFAKGIDQVPYDMLAYIHRDEAVLDPRESAAWRSGDASGLRALAVRIDNMEQRMVGVLDDVADATRKAAAVLSNEGGQLIQVQVVSV